jgi:cytochrome c556
VAVLSGVLAVSVVSASEKPPENYVAAMKTINTNNGALRRQVPAKDYEGLAATAAALKPAFETTLKFWQEKKVDDAIGWATDVLKMTADLDAAVKAKDDAAIQTAATAISGSCRTCHDAHRERLPDGSSMIK